MDLLKNYEVDFGEETFNQLVELPDRWNAVKKLAAQTKQLVSPLLARQIDILKKRFNYFDFRQKNFLAKFHSNDVFKFVIHVLQLF